MLLFAQKISWPSLWNNTNNPLANIFTLWCFTLMIARRKKLYDWGDQELPWNKLCLVRQSDDMKQSWTCIALILFICVKNTKNYTFWVIFKFRLEFNDINVSGGLNFLNVIFHRQTVLLLFQVKLFTLNQLYWP